MSKINLKTDYEDGNILHGDEINIDNSVTMLGVNDNFNRINSLNLQKADIAYVNNIASTKVDLSTLNTRLQEINLTKANKSDLATKADQSEVDKKANQSYVDSQLSIKANQSYVDAQLSNKVNLDDYDENINKKVDKETIGELSDLKTDDKSSIVNAINSINTEAKTIATVESVGVVKPDGTTITIDQDGTIHSVGGGAEPGGTSDYNELSNKPQINNVEIKGNISLEDLGLIDANSVRSELATKADIANVYNKNYIDTNVISPLNDKADKIYVDSKLEYKANVSDVYNKSSVDTLIASSESNTDAKLLLKADSSNVYSKSEVDSKIATKADNLSIVDDKLQLMSGSTPIGDQITVSVSGNEVVISPEQPTGEDWKLWIDSDEVQNLGSEVVDTLDGNETNKAPSVRAIKEELNIYSTEEVRIGTWIDGKPIYRKVIRVRNITVNKTAEINTGITNFDKLVKISGLFENYSNSKYAPYPFYDNDPTKTLQVYVTFDGTKIKFDGNTSFTQNPNRYHTFILEYTKTTDTATTSTLSEVTE